MPNYQPYITGDVSEHTLGRTGDGSLNKQGKKETSANRKGNQISIRTWYRA